MIISSCCCFVFLISLAVGGVVSTKGIRCYTCTSYMKQCRETVTNSPADVYRAGCSSKCFIRRGEDSAIYRGCFDDFAKVSHLQDDYVGCRNQTWNNKSLRWCFCSTDLCNGIEMDSMDSLGTISDNNPKESPLLAHASTTTSTVAPSLNTDHNIFKFLDSETDDLKHQNNKNREAFKQSQSEGSYEIIDGYGQGEEDQGQEQVINILDHAVSEPEVSDQKESGYDGYGDGNLAKFDADYPFNQDFYSISRIVDDLMKRDKNNNKDHKKAEAPAADQSGYRSFDAAFKESLEDVDYVEHIRTPQASAHELLSAEIGAKMDPCSETGYYAHPSDCSVYMACVYEPRSRTATWHMMPCPGQLYWDDVRKICVEYSINCPTSGQKTSLDLH